MHIKILTISSLCCGCLLHESPSGPGRVKYNTSSAYHTQHVCHVVRRDISAIKFDRVKNHIYFIFFFYWLKPLTDEVFGCEDRLTVVFRCDSRVTVVFCCDRRVTVVFCCDSRATVVFCCDRRVTVVFCCDSRVTVVL